MNLNDRVQFAGQIVTIRAVYNHIVSGKPRYLIEHANKTFSKVGAESLAPIEPERSTTQLPNLSAFHRTPAKARRVLK